MTEPANHIATINPAGWREAPYIEQWMGPWAMREAEFNALAETVRGLNVSLHLDSQAARDAARSSELAQAGYERDAAGVATIELRGRMQKQYASLGQSASTVALRRAIRAAADDPEVGAILLIADSPGGTVAGTAELAADVAAATAKKDVFGLAEDMAASACYWVLAQCTRVLTQQAAMVGSIGTYGVVYDESAAAAQQGVKVHVVRAGAQKGAGIPGTEVTTEQLLAFQQEIDSLNELFVAGIAQGRQMSLDDARKLATGQVWIGQQAVDAGLADEVASIDQALATARAASLKRLGKDGRKNMAAATYQELAASCVGATPEFICKQLAAGASLEQSVKDWMTHQNAALEAARKETADVTAKAKVAVEAALAKTKVPGVDALPEGAAGGKEGGGGNAFEEFNAAVEAKVQAGMKRPKAVAAAVRENPARHAALIAEANAGRKLA